MVFYKFTACTSTLKSINLPHSSRLISKANHFVFELRSSIFVLHCVLRFCVCITSSLCYTFVYCVAVQLSRFLLVGLKPTFKSIAAIFGSLSKACVEFALLELRIQQPNKLSPCWKLCVHSLPGCTATLCNTLVAESH